MSAPSTLAHARAFELLPWLVNGTLSGAERDAVEEHVRACITCRRELKDQQQLQAAVRSRHTADVSADAGFERLDRALDETLSAGRWRQRYFATAPFVAAAAAGVAVLALLVWFTPLPQPDGAQYSTLATPPAGNTLLLDIVFAEDATAAEMQALLDEVGGEIVAGPSELGRYQVRIDHGAEDDARIGGVLAALGSDPRVRFAGRSLTERLP